MRTITIKDVFDGTYAAEDLPEEAYRIYVVREGEIVFYIGQSSDVPNRLLEHFAHIGRGSSSALGGFYDEHKEKSSSWEIDLYTVTDCAPLVREALGMTEEAYYRHNPRLVSKIEKAMMKRFSPCLNSMGNENQTPLPEKYLDTYYAKLEDNAVDYLAFLAREE